jgi:Flp pilus assembly protein TadG
LPRRSADFNASFTVFPARAGRFAVGGRYQRGGRRVRLSNGVFGISDLFILRTIYLIHKASLLDFYLIWTGEENTAFRAGAMLTAISNLWRRFGRDEGGNVFVLFGASAIPLLLIMGGAVDLTRYSRYRTELSNAVDAAALALARVGKDYTEAQAKTYVQNYVNSFGITDSYFSVTAYNVDKTDNGFRVEADGSMKTMFLPIGNLTDVGTRIMNMDMDVVAEVVHSSNRLEVALVFDNTGSMNCGNGPAVGWCVYDWSSPDSSSRIVALKAAAHTLLDTLMADDVEIEHIKIGMVPFEGTVNIGSTYANNPPSWVDWSNHAQAKYNGQNFGKYNHSSGAACTTGSNCKFVGHKWLFDRLKHNDSAVKWEGCVEMRAEPYDILDTTPTTATPDTLFVPYFWPDEPDSDNDDGDSYQNNYLDDNTSSDGSVAQKRVQKYYNANIDWHSGAKDTSFPFESGPNYGCPRPIVPLTNDKATLETAVDNMVAYYSNGTYIPVGLVWGWHVLSPNEPFTEGIAPDDEYYEQTVKALVLFTDGENMITATDNHNGSVYSGYNYAELSVGGSYRLDDDVDDAIDELDDKTEDLCENVKSAGIRLYAITFGSMSSEDEELMENCATEDDGEPLYYHAPTTSDLEDIFREIGEDLSEIHLSM